MNPINSQSFYTLNQSGIQFNVFGQEHIEEGAMHQMFQAAKLPVRAAGALMPDARSGYGLSISDLLTTENGVISYCMGATYLFFSANPA